MSNPSHPPAEIVARSSRRALAPTVQQPTELEALGDLARALVTTVGLEELLNEIVASIGRVLAYRDCVLYLWKENDRKLVQSAAHGPKRSDDQGGIINPLRLELGEGIVGAVATSRIGNVAEDVSKDPRYVADLETCAAEITVPIVYHDQLIGVIDAESSELGAFSAGDLEMLERFSDLCAPAIVNAIRLKAQQEEASSLLHQTRVEYREMVENTSDVVYKLDPDMTISYINPSGTLLLGRPAAEIVGRSIVDLIPRGSRSGLLAQLELLRREGSHLSTVDLPMLRADGAIRLTEQTLTRAGGENRFKGFHAIARDVSERRELEEKLTKLASHDLVTELFNRHRFEEELEKEIELAAGTDGRLAVLWLDLDQFKDINDTRGHRAGDQLLSQLALVLKEILRSDDLVARIGGDEFAVLLRHTDRENAERAAQRLVEGVAEHSFLIADSPVKTSMSVGIALLPEHGTTVEEALLHSDLAMYSAKEAGRNSFHTFTQDDAQRSELTTRLSISEKLRVALRDDLFVLHAQPIMDLRSGEISGQKLLIRLPDEDKLLLPGYFIGVAERIGLISEID